MHYVPSKGVFGKIWFKGCLLDDCMVKDVSIALVTPSAKNPSSTINISPGLEPFILQNIWTGKTFPKSDHYSIEVRYGVNILLRKDLPEGEWLLNGPEIFFAVLKPLGCALTEASSELSNFCGLRSLWGHWKRVNLLQNQIESHPSIDHTRCINKVKWNTEEP